MSYAAALDKAWGGIAGLKGSPEVAFLGERYAVYPDKRLITLKGAVIAVKDYLAIILLHYLAKRLNTLPEPEGEWISFNEIEGGAGYYPAFKKRVIDVIIRRYGCDNGLLIDSCKRLGGRRSDVADTAMIIEPLEKVPVLVTLWKSDEEFGPEGNMHFDKSISRIFCAEDIVVFSEILAHKL